MQGLAGNGGQEIITINEYLKGITKYLAYVNVRNKNICLARPKVKIIYQTNNAVSRQMEIAPQSIDCSNGGGATAVAVALAPLMQ